MLSHIQNTYSIDIEFENISYSIKEGFNRSTKRIIKNVDGCFKSGNFTAIMGASGAGKSTLMNILAGYKTSNLSGKVLVNGRERIPQTFRRMSCYIMQEDCFSPYLTVKEAITIAAHFKLGKKSEKERTIIIDEVIKTLGLLNCIDIRTANISGGQKKRLSIALEMVNNPPVMFFDEPTSGLDISTSSQCLSLLKSLAEGGRTIICTIHQPSAKFLELFDHLYVLAEGQCIYRGKVDGLVPFLFTIGLTCPSTYNPSDYLLEIAIEDNVGKLVDATKEKEKVSKNSPINNEIVTSSYTNDYSASQMLQFWILLKTTMTISLRNKIYTRLRLVAHLVVAVLVSILYYDIGNKAGRIQNNMNLIFFIITFTQFVAMLPTILTFPLDMSIFKREYLNHWYSLKTYYFAKTIADIPFQIVMDMTYIIIIHYFTSQPMEVQRFAMVLLVYEIAALIGQTYGLMLGAMWNIQNGLFLAALLISNTATFCGFFVRLEDISEYIRWISYTDYLKYTFEGAMIAIFGLDRKKLECDEEFCLFTFPKYLLQEMGLKDDMDSYLFDIYILTAMFFVLRFLTYYTLRFKIKISF